MKKLTITLLALSFFAINIATAQTTEKIQTEQKVYNKAIELKVQDESKLMKLDKHIPIERKIGAKKIEPEKINIEPEAKSRNLGKAKKENLIEIEKFNKEPEKIHLKKAVEEKEKK